MAAETATLQNRKTHMIVLHVKDGDNGIITLNVPPAVKNHEHANRIVPGTLTITKEQGDAISKATDPVTKHFFTKGWLVVNDHQLEDDDFIDATDDDEDEEPQGEAARKPAVKKIATPRGRTR